MSLWSFLTGTLRDCKLDRLAAGVADECHDEAWKIVHSRAICMRLAEARGYVRAKTLPLIEEGVDRVLEADASLPLSVRQDLVDRTSAVLVSLLIRDVLHLPRKTQPLRRAA